MTGANESVSRVDRDLIHALYAQGPLTTLIAMVIGGIVVGGLWNEVPAFWLIAWYLLVLANQAVRLGLVAAFHRERPEGGRLGVWARRYTIGMAASAVAFGSLATLTFPQAGPAGQVLLTITACGMAVGSITANAYHPPAMFAYPSIMLLPLFLRLALQGNLNYWLLAVAVIFFLAVILVFGRRQAELIRRSIAIGHENADLIEELKLKTAQAEAAQHKAEQASLAKSQFFAAASHDLRQPLQALGLFAASLREAKRDADDTRRIDQILSSVDTLESLFDELLDISKLDAGYVKPVPAHFLVQPMFEQLENAYAPLARRNGLDLAFEDNGAVLFSDSVLIERVLGNFIANALRYTQHGGVTVRCVAAGERRRIEVADTGPGIPREEHERVFDEFYQLSNPERDRRKGLGLGLATVRRIGQLLGAPIGLDSGPGRGSVFSIAVPAGDAAQVAPRRGASGEVDVDTLRGKVIGVVDDERDVRDGLTEVLGLWRCTPVAAATVAELCEKLDADGAQPHAFIVDYRLRDYENGAAAVAALRARYGDGLPALIVSGDTAPEIFKSMQQQKLPLLSKPVRASRLRAALQHLLSSASCQLDADLQKTGT